MPKLVDLTNDIAVRALRWTEGDPIQFEVKDKHRAGFYIRISKGGTKRWYYRYTKARKVRQFSLGRYPAVSCANAFKLYEDARKALEHGGDPYQEKKDFDAAKKMEEAKKQLTLSVLFHEHYLKRHSRPNLRTWKNDKLYFETKIEDILGAIPASQIAPEQVNKLIGDIEAGGQYATARLTLATLRKTFNWAATSDSSEKPGEPVLLDVPNPCRQYKLGKKPPAPSRFFSEKEIADIWNVLGNRETGRIAKFQLLTGCRVTEAAGMKWSEIDFNTGIWECPISRVKNKKVSLKVPLTNRMLELIGSPNNSEFVFPSKWDKKKHTTGDGVSQRIKWACRELKIKKGTSHTMRKTFTTHMTRLGVGLEIRNQLTNHIDSSVDYTHYNFYTFFDEKKEALIKWDNEISRILKANGNN